MTRRAQDNTKALDAFLAAKFEIDAMLARLAALSADHFETNPDEIHWGARWHPEPLPRQAARVHRQRLQGRRTRHLTNRNARTPPRAQRGFGS
jgi:hypothetical protein